jgi:spore coat protein U-like protein
LKIAFASLSNSLLVEFLPAAAHGSPAPVAAGQQGERGMLFRHRARLLLGAAAFTAVAILNGSPGLAATATGTMTVQASVVQTCSLGTIGTLDFGAYQPGTTKNAQADFVVDCTIAGPVNVAFNLGQNSNGADIWRMKNGTSNFIRYNLYTTSSRNAVWNAPQTKTVSSGPNTMTVWGAIVGAQAPSAPAGSYSDTVTITVEF